MRPTALFVSATLVALCAGCASAPATHTATTAPADCAQLGADIAAAESARRQAQADKDGAWKAVVPFAVAARYAKSSSAAGEAQQRLDTLQAQARRQGCPVTPSSQGDQP